MKKIRFFIQYLAAFLIILLLLFTIASVVIIKFYGDDVKHYAMNLVNEQVDTKISVGDMGVSILRKFPYTSVFFNDVTVWSGHGFDRDAFRDQSPDTLLHSERIYLQFNLLDLMRKRYNVKHLEIKNGDLRVLIDPAGRGNFTVTENKEDKGSGALVKLRGVSLRNVSVTYLNLAKEMEMKLRLQEIDLQGDFSKENYRLDVLGTAHIASLYNHKILYLSHQQVKTDASLKVEGSLFTITRGTIELGDLMASATGTIHTEEDGTAMLALQLEGRRIGLELLTNLVGGSSNEQDPGIKATGKLDFSAAVTGPAGPASAPHIEASFSTHGATFFTSALPGPLREISLEGTYENGSLNNQASSVIKISSLHTRFRSSGISATLNIKNLLSPVFQMNVTGDLHLFDLKDLVEPQILDLRGGVLKPELELKGRINGLGGENPGITVIPYGTIQLEKVEFATLDMPVFSDVNGTVDVQNRKWKAAVKGKQGKASLSADVHTIGFLDYLLRDTDLYLTGSLEGTDVDLDVLFDDSTEEDQGENENPYPENLACRLNVDFNGAQLENLQVNHVTGIVGYNFPTMYFDSLRIDGLDGHAEGRAALYDLDRNEYRLSVSADYRHLEIQQLFDSFDNFGQDFITDHNISGKLTGSSSFTASMRPDFSMESDGIISENHIIIDDGRLVDFEPMIELSKFLKIDHLDDVRFSRLENTILIHDNIVHIPEMEIRSSAMNLKASGTQNFDMTYNYHLAIKLSELLFNKAKSAGKSEFEVALDPEDQRTVFLTLYDTGNGMTVDFDENQAMKKIREDLKDEKNELKVILNEEFGIFKNDEVVKENQKKEAAPVLRFEFNDDSPADSTTTDQDKKKKHTKSKIDFVIDDSDL